MNPDGAKYGGLDWSATFPVAAQNIFEISQLAGMICFERSRMSDLQIGHILSKSFGNVCWKFELWFSHWLHELFYSKKLFLHITW